MILGTAVGQGVSFLAIPLLARLYSDASFGVYGLALNFLTLGIVVANGKYEMAIPGGATERERHGLFHAALLASLVATPLLALGWWALTASGAVGFGQAPEGWAGWIALASLAASSGFALRYLALSQERFADVGWVTAIQGASRPVLQAALFSFGPLGLVIGEALSRVVGIWRLARAVRPLPRPSLAEIREAATRHKRFPKWVMPSALIDSGASLLVLPLIAHYFGLAAAGQYFMVQRVVSIPVGLLGGGIADALHVEFARLAREDGHALRPFFLRSARRLVLIGAACGGLIALLGLFGAVPVLGPHWSMAGQMLALSSPWAAAMLAVSPLTRSLLLSESGPKLKLGYDLAAVGITVAAVVGGHAASLNPVAVVGLLAAGQTVAYAGYFMLVLRLLPQPVAPTAGLVLITTQKSQEVVR